MQVPKSPQPTGSRWALRWNQAEERAHPACWVAKVQGRCWGVEVAEWELAGWGRLRSRGLI